ncbi:MAG: tryptophan synthase subunit alpha [Actinomycetota bacterium]|nr:tryptophan synthase subunit alpha [Actinomycetota bacterium]
MSGESRIAAAFEDSGKRAALMPYMMGGFPDLAESRAIGEAYADSGADLIELGVPYSDPLADGPVIHAAGSAALAAGISLDGVFELAEALSKRVPVVVMCYANLIYARGIERFCEELAQAGGSGVIVPDIPLEEAPALRASCQQAGLALVPLIAPTTPEPRLEAIGSHAAGFLYTVSVAGITGERSSVDASVAALVKRARAHTEVPVAVGFGIASPDHAVAVADAGADGIIVGTRFVREAAEAVEHGKSPADAVRSLASEFSSALKR